ncbi:MAG: hypothetical protein L6R40_004599 [Gallowayella cf. fulva]|nr:MAG: hypothetical protein L6R40_004599 [Xanthomendoza cf. fulva]
MPSPAALGAVNGHDSNGKSKANDSVSPQSKEEKEALLAKLEDRIRAENQYMSEEHYFDDPESSSSQGASTNQTTQGPDGQSKVSRRSFLRRHFPWLKVHHANDNAGHQVEGNHERARGRIQQWTKADSV